MPEDDLFIETDEPSRFIWIGQGRIRGIGAPRPAGVPRADARSSDVLPGWVNAHTHVYGGLAPLGMPPPEPPPQIFPEILERLWWRLDRALDEETLRAAARLYVAEALLQGTTALVDHHESPGFIQGSLDVLADACEELGMRALLCYGATERNGGREEARRGLSECRRFVESNRNPLLLGTVGLHASFTVSDETIREAADLCGELGTVLHTHLAEDAVEIDDAVRRGYPGPLERLAALGALPSGSILAHGVHLDAQQVALAAEAGCWLVQNPRSNASNRVGYPPALWSSPLVALGTDGFPSNMPLEERELLRAAKGWGDAEERAAARRLAGGRTLIGERFGGSFGLDEGDVADLVVIPADQEGAPFVRHVIVAGRLVVEDGVLLTGDVDAIRAEAREKAERLWSRYRQI